MSRQQNSQPRHEERELWRSQRRTSDTTATFRPGEELRCPGILRVAGYSGPCGCSFDGERAKPHTRVMIRVRAAAVPELPHAGTELRCHRCGTALEKYTIREEAE